MYQDLEKTQAGEPPMVEAQTPEAADHEPLSAQVREARLQCVQQYLMSVVSQKDAVRAGFGVINAGLMAVTVPFAEVLEKYLRKPSLSIDNVQKILPTLDTYHRLTRLIERFGQLDARIAPVREKKRPLGS
jgi:hypothetical protein